MKVLRKIQQKGPDGNLLNEKIYLGSSAEYIKMDDDGKTLAEFYEEAVPLNHAESINKSEIDESGTQIETFKDENEFLYGASVLKPHALQTSLGHVAVVSLDGLENDETYRDYMVPSAGDTIKYVKNSIEDNKSQILNNYVKNIYTLKDDIQLLNKDEYAIINKVYPSSFQDNAIFISQKVGYRADGAETSNEFFDLIPTQKIVGYLNNVLLYDLNDCSSELNQTYFIDNNTINIPAYNIDFGFREAIIDDVNKKGLLKVTVTGISADEETSGARYIASYYAYVTKDSNQEIEWIRTCYNYGNVPTVEGGNS